MGACTALPTRLMSSLWPCSIGIDEDSRRGLANFIHCLEAVMLKELTKYCCTCAPLCSFEGAPLEMET